MTPAVHEVSVVIPVYQGERTLEKLVAEIEPLQKTQGNYRVNEVLLVYDGAIDGSAEVIQRLAARLPFVRPIWLSRNYGQHAATLAGMASTTSEWIVTMDEDGLHRPSDIGKLIDRALETQAPLVYALPTNDAPHGWLRNLASRAAKWVFCRVVGNRHIGKFNSFRLVRGDLGRSLAAYCGSNVYLDVALSWVSPAAAQCPIELRSEGPARRSGYNWFKLGDHFFRLLLTSGKMPLRLITLLGCVSIGVSIAITAYALYQKLSGLVPVAGWTSLTILVCFFSGIILFCLGVVAEYLGSILTMSMGQPLYLIVREPVTWKQK